jgi:hypothetical protein
MPAANFLIFGNTSEESPEYNILRSDNSKDFSMNH